MWLGEPNAQQREAALEALTGRIPKQWGPVALRNVDRDRFPVRPGWVRARPETGPHEPSLTLTDSPRDERSRFAETPMAPALRDMVLRPPRPERTL
jgi:hypothetical protein